ncbi:hypothetical protein HRR83_005684 [Exophiala dermatitidis]|uniref:Uncharacterized protein n=1 Tax=Exophiala dermatitidis TaxID=5970 RepID=A0AAN6IQT5_EXODE|nr:hypothetical protein HRR73_007484 [Exophiala dermatitidis]KAJ4513240.1 hypothetical protein HRR74_006052 [Exophiala dermatitidis]KAJ4532022.1 hypothetical protein HRR77_008983 [Exophiala dermatitidis]KAJ4539951.1 hypothetical protein HRR76_003375 [Exophiala dermatitidis]KAJ4567897.1 hypothetical protein HRR81_006809 [Exophiala dermatitidis]
MMPPRMPSYLGSADVPFQEYCRNLVGTERSSDAKREGRESEHDTERGGGHGSAAIDIRDATPRGEVRHAGAERTERHHGRGAGWRTSGIEVGLYTICWRRAPTTKAPVISNLNVEEPGSSSESVEQSHEAVTRQQGVERKRAGNLTEIRELTLSRTRKRALVCYCSIVPRAGSYKSACGDDHIERLASRVILRS